MKTFIIKENDSNQRLDKFITKTVPSLPKSLLYKYIRLKRIKVNQKRAEISTRLQTGDTVDLYIKDEFFEKQETRYDFTKAGTNLKIVYEDGNIMLLNKPAGLLCHPDNREYTDTLIARVKRYLYEKDEYSPDDENSFTPALANRIDRNTSGIVMAAKNAESLRILNQKIKDREIQKFYLCIVHGTPKPESGTLKGYLCKNEQKNMVKVYPSPVNGSKEIQTKYRVLQSIGKLSLLEIELLTGRTHQIRSHFAAIGHPLLGDGKYGTNKLNKEKGYKKQCLCSYKLTFQFTTDSGLLAYLNGKTFEIDDVWFRQAFMDGSL